MLQKIPGGLTTTTNGTTTGDGSVEVGSGGGRLGTNCDEMRDVYRLLFERYCDDGSLISLSTVNKCLRQVFRLHLQMIIERSYRQGSCPPFECFQNKLPILGNLLVRCYFYMRAWEQVSSLQQMYLAIDTTVRVDEKIHIKDVSLNSEMPYHAYLISQLLKAHIDFGLCFQSKIKADALVELLQLVHPFQLYAGIDDIIRALLENIEKQILSTSPSIHLSFFLLVQLLENDFLNSSKYLSAFVPLVIKNIHHEQAAVQQYALTFLIRYLKTQDNSINKNTVIREEYLPLVIADVKSPIRKVQEKALLLLVELVSQGLMPEEDLAPLIPIVIAAVQDLQSKTHQTAVALLYELVSQNLIIQEKGFLLIAKLVSQKGSQIPQEALEQLKSFLKSISPQSNHATKEQVLELLELLNLQEALEQLRSQQSNHATKDQVLALLELLKPVENKNSAPSKEVLWTESPLSVQIFDKKLLSNRNPL